MDNIKLNSNVIKLEASTINRSKSYINFDAIDCESNSRIYELYTTNENFIDGVFKMDIYLFNNENIEEHKLKEAIILFTEYVFNNFPIHKIQYDTYENNSKIIKILQEIGFEVEAKLLEDCYIDGKYINKIILSTFKTIEGV